MKTRSFLTATLSLTLLLTACGPKTFEDQITISDVYTAVAMTITAQPSAIPPTATVTPIPTATALAFSTLSISTAYPTATSYASYVNAVSGCDSSVYVSDVTIPDGTEMAPGETFVKTWMFQNTGSCSWSTSYSLVFFGGSDMDGSDATIGQSVDPGEDAEISVSLTAPDTAGTYTGYWMLANASGVTFGEAVYVQIVVSEDAATLTPTATSTSTSITSTSTSTSTPIPTNTNTTIPTETPQPTPTSTLETPTDASDQ